MLAEVLYVLSQDETNLLRLHFLSREEPDMVYYPAFFRCQIPSRNPETEPAQAHTLTTHRSQMDQAIHPRLPGCLTFRHQPVGDHSQLSLVFARQLSTAADKPPSKTDMNQSLDLGGSARVEPTGGDAMLDMDPELDVGRGWGSG